LWLCLYVLLLLLLLLHLYTIYNTYINLYQTYIKPMHHQRRSPSSHRHPPRMPALPLPSCTMQKPNYNNDPLNTPWIHGHTNPLFDLAYADDTILMGKEAATVQRALHLVQNTAAQYNLKLNLGKCELLRIHETSHATNNIYFNDNTQVNHTIFTNYLGVYLRNDCKMSTDISARLARARAGLNKLHTFWRHSDISLSQNLRIYKATLIPMIAYGMESAAFANANITAISAFQHQALRKMFNQKSTYYSTVLSPEHPTTHDSELDNLAAEQHNNH
jgi:hypothetical protein